MFYNIIKGIANIVFSIFYRINYTGLEHVIMEGNIILASNHASNLDPIFLSIVFPRQVHWMAKKELFNSKVLAFLISKLGAFPVDRDNMDIGAVKNSLRILKDDKVLGVFPEGTRVKEFDLENVKSGVALLSVKSKSPIIPAYIDTNYKLFSKVNIIIGEPIELTQYYNTRPINEDYQNLGKEILQTIYGLKD